MSLLCDYFNTSETCQKDQSRGLPLGCFSPVRLGPLKAGSQKGRSGEGGMLRFNVSPSEEISAASYSLDPAFQGSD